MTRAVPPPGLGDWPDPPKCHPELGHAHRLRYSGPRRRRPVTTTTTEQGGCDNNTPNYGDSPIREEGRS